MQVNITFRNFDPSDSLKAFAREKVERVGRFLDQATEANIVLSVEKHLHHAEVMLHSGPFFLRGSEKTDDMYASIGIAVDKVERQIKRHKGRLRSFKPQSHHREEALRVAQEILEVEPLIEDVEDTTQQEVEATKPRVIRESELLARRMTVDEALTQIQLTEAGFLVFTNAETGGLSVLYRRDEDESTFGLLNASTS